MTIGIKQKERKISMRLDKYLKNSRLIKRRTLAKRVADQERIKINGKTAKASANVAVGDEIEIQFGQNRVTINVREVKEVVRKQEAALLYTVIKEERNN